MFSEALDRNWSPEKFVEKCKEVSWMSKLIQKHNRTSVFLIAIRLEAIALRGEAIAFRLEAIVIRRPL